MVYRTLKGAAWGDEPNPCPFPMREGELTSPLPLP